MKVRYPNFDFAAVKAHWAPCIEFAQRANASSIIPSYVEPYLVKVMLKARPQIRPSETALDQDVVVFCKQEAQHNKQHNVFNSQLRAQGYEGLLAIEQALEADLNRFIETKSLKFNVAYAEGFEALGALGAEMWFNCYREYLDGADKDVVAMWQWHMAEEYEHREVAFNVYHELFGRKNLFDAWIYRVGVFIFAARHLLGFGDRAAELLLTADRAKMTDEERQASLAREKAFKKKMARTAIPELIKVLSPFYQPRTRKAPAGWQDYLKGYEAA